MTRSRFRTKIAEQFSRENYKSLFYLLTLSFLINLFVELLARRSIDDTVLFIVQSPILFLYGILIVWFTISLSLLMKRRNFWLLLLSAVWVGLAVTDFILLSSRSMPLTASDIWLMSSVRDIFEKYLTRFELALLMLGIAALLGLIILLWGRAKKQKSIFLFGAFHAIALGVLVFLATLLLQCGGELDRPHQFDNLPRAYHDNGFVYSFSASLLTGGVDEPDNFTPDEVDAIIEEQETLPATTKKAVNIVFVQLESFMDPKCLRYIVPEENAIPNFTRLKERYPSGLLSVPAIGAGTANTEFEILTGMNLNHFGVGEYPYMTTVNSDSVASIASVLGAIGYQTHAIHNNNATFYDRHIVYNNLGFDSFTSLEYMNGVQWNPRNWAKDSVLTGEILKTLEATKEKDFIFTVSVQPHGKYPSEPLEGAPVIAATGFEDEARQNGFEYYLGQLHECDAFVGSLTQALSHYHEPTVVVFYGDHLPSFNFGQEELAYGTTQTTEYVIWSNFATENIDFDLQTYQLSAYVMNFCGIHEGTIFRLHQTYDFGADDDEAYQNALSVLEYSALNDSSETNQSSDEPLQPLMRFGVEDIVILGITADEQEGYIIEGKRFTPYSKVMLDGTLLQTEFISENLLRIAQSDAQEGRLLSVAQVSATDELEILSTCEPIELSFTEEESP